MGNFNIVFLGFLLGFGGAEKSMIKIANGLSKLNYRVTIISFKYNNVVYDLDNNVNYIFIPDKQRGKVMVPIKRLVNLRSHLKIIKPDLVISFWFQPIIFATLLSPFLKYKTIYSERTDPTSKAYQGIIGLLRKIFFRFIDGFVFQTQGAKKCFPEYIQKKSTVINNPVYIKYNDYDTPHKRRKTIVNVGRLHKQKNHKLLINAFSKISPLFPDYTLEIYGEGEEKEDLVKEIRKLNLEKKVILKGTTRNLFDKIVDASLFVLSSDYEGMPNALMEAMALGIPSISTDCKPGGARELINNNFNGVLCATNSVKQLAEAIKHMLENRKVAEFMGLKAKDICKTHSMESILKQWDVYLRRVCF